MATATTGTQTTTPLTVSGTTTQVVGSTSTAKPISSAAVLDLIGLQKDIDTDAAQVKSQDIIAKGDQKEADAYGTASNTALEQARIERVAGAIQDYKDEAKIYQTVSGQKADVAAAGFGSGGSALYLMRNSYSQGAITRQLNEAQTAITAGGYESQSAASLATQAAAQAASDAATSLSTSAAAAGSTAKTNATNYANSLIKQSKAPVDGTTSTGTTSTGTSTAKSSTSTDSTKTTYGWGETSAKDAEASALALGYKKTELGWSYSGTPAQDNSLKSGTGAGTRLKTSDEGKSAAQDFVNSENARLKGTTTSDTASTGTNYTDPTATNYVDPNATIVQGILDKLG